jgi:3-hydroxyisobutyrate dehydrogenase
MAESGPTDVALIGLGNMGASMAHQWNLQGVQVHGFDVFEDARKRVESLGVQTYRSANEAAARATICILMLPNSQIVDRVIDDLIANDALKPGVVLVDMSSSEPMRTRHNFDKLVQLGVEFVDAPVSGGVRGVDGRTLAIMAGGSEAAVERVRPVLSRLGEVTHVGEIGAGHVAKTLNNYVAATHLWVTSEAVLLAKQYGILEETMVSVLNQATGRSVSSEVKWPKFILNRKFNSGFSAGLLSKDLGIAASMAQGLGVPSLLAGHVAELWQSVVSDLGESADHTEVASWIAATYSDKGE